jgi:SAM-dependent methyltransferase
MPISWQITDGRTRKQIREHYDVERALADKLRKASKGERGRLYGDVYNELFRRVSHHPQLVNRASLETRRAAATRQARFLRQLVPGKGVFLEVGAGDCLLSLELAADAVRVYAVDVSDEITKLTERPANFKLVLSDGCSIDVPRASVDLAFSNQLMEHLHPDDALEQLRNIYSALARGGRYFCITPNRLSGPHDVSRSFDDVATGFHLREYTIADLKALFAEVGFKRFRAYIGLDGRYLRVPILAVKATEAIVSAMPPGLRKSLASTAPFRLMLGLRLLATK